MKEEKRRKRKKQQYDGERYKNLPEDVKKSLLSIEKNTIKRKKNTLIQLEENIILKSDDLESSFHEECVKTKYLFFLRNQFWSYKLKQKK